MARKNNYHDWPSKEESEKVFRHLERSDCRHVNKGLSSNPSARDVIKYILQQRILRKLHEMIGDWAIEKDFPILKEKIKMGKDRATYLLYGWLDRFTLGEMINHADALGVDYQLTIKFNDTDPAWLGNIERKKYKYE